MCDIQTVNLVIGGRSAEVREDLLEHRDEEGHERDQHQSGETRDQARIDHRGLDLAPQRVVLLELVGDPQQRRLEDAAALARRDHRDVEIVEDVGVAPQRR
jgi:hypothetical protein